MSVDRAQIEHIRSFVATPRCMSYETIRSLGDILDNLEAASAEVAALRRQVEEMRASADTVTVPRDRLTELVRRFLELAETVGQFKELAKIDERHLQDAGFRAQRVQP